MKSLIKFLLYGLIALLGLVALVAAYIQIKGVSTYEYQVPPEIANLKVQNDSTQVAPGLKIASMLCKSCHAEFETGKLTDHIMTDLPEEFGTDAYYNITHDEETGIG